MAQSALEQSIREICAAHDLQSFQIGLLIPNDVRNAGWSVSVQRWAQGSPAGCWQANGTSIATALAEAIAQANAPAVSLTDEPLELAA